MKHYYQTIQGWFDYSELYSNMVKKFPSGSYFVEVGSWKGTSAVYMGVEIINSGKTIMLDCIDDWEFNDDIYNNDSSIIKLRENAYDEFIKNIQPLSKIIKYYKLNSIEAANLYGDTSLDFVFIDASHEYKNVRRDIIAWYPKVKHGGVFAGHDYGGGWVGVTKAVDEFFKGKKIETLNNTWIYYK